MESNAASDRRIFPRIKTSFPVKGEIEKIAPTIPSKFVGKMVNISEEGSSLVLNTVLAPQSSVILCVNLPSPYRPVEIEAKVMWSDFRSKDNKVHCGLTFSKMKSDSQATLSRYINDALIGKGPLKERRKFERRRNVLQLKRQLVEKELELQRMKEKIKNRVVITGLGVVAPNGIGKEAFWQAIKKGKNCVGKITLFDPSGLPSRVAAEIKEFHPEEYLKPDDAMRMDRATQFAVAAAKLATKDGNMKIDSKNAHEIGVIMGTGGSGMAYGEKQMFIFWKEGIKKVHPYAGISSFCGALSSGISIELGLKGLSLTISTGCTGGNDAIGYSFNLIRHGMAHTIFTGGADACITEGILAFFCRMGAASTHWNTEPKKASRPFNKDRDGFVIGEGAWVLILEELNHALERGAHIYAEVVGYGATCDAYHMTRPLPSATELANAMKNALQDGGVKPEEVQYINAHGTSTPLNDANETLAIKKVFGTHAYSLAVSSLKSMIGHPQGASGAAGVTAIALAMENSWLPPTINYENPDPECDLDYVPNKGRRARFNVGMCNSIGFGAKNSVIVLRKYKE
jgi:3-oxoacyl-[acyl-carrier-protein] synthase II